MNEHGVDFFQKNREGDTARGGAAILVDRRKGSFKEFRLFATSCETVAALGTMHGYNRKLLIVCTYMPPGMRSSGTCFEEIIGIINEAKVIFPDPFVVVGGDFNEFNTEPLTTAFSELVIAESPPTRADRKIDLLLTNFNRCIKKCSSREPLSNLEGTLSDNNVMYYQAALPKKTLAKWVTITRRKYTPEGEAAFGE